MKFTQAIDRYEAEKFDKKTLNKDMYHFNLLHPFLGDTSLQCISMNDLWPFIQHRRAQGVKNSTINRSLEVVRHTLHLAKDEWLQIDQVPKIKLLKEAPLRVRFLSADESNCLLAELPDHLSPLVQYALATGCRKSEILNLEWDRVDLSRKVAWLDAGMTKNDDARGIPLNADAIRALEKVLKDHSRYVFTYCGEKMAYVGSAFKKALKRAKIEDFTFHDLRHTWASWHVMSGTPLYELMLLGGWKTIECVQRYAHLAPEHLARAARRIETKEKIFEVH
jgi:integrase